MLLPLLRGRGETRIDTLVLSHRDLDHVGDACSVLGAMPVGDLLSSLEAEHPLLQLAPRAERCSAGQGWSWDGVRFEVLGPPQADYARNLKPNAMSYVLRVSGGGRSALLTGDIEREQEAALVAGIGGALHSDVLIVPHHGSSTSSTRAFLDAVQPRAAVFQAGYRSRFGHPAPDVLERYRERGITILQTPACGAWLWPVVQGQAGSGDGRENGLAGGRGGGDCYRDVARRYWHHEGG